MSLASLHITSTMSVVSQAELIISLDMMRSLWWEVYTVLILRSCCPLPFDFSFRACVHFHIKKHAQILRIYLDVFDFCFRYSGTPMQWMWWGLEVKGRVAKTSDVLLPKVTDLFEKDDLGHVTGPCWQWWQEVSSFKQTLHFLIHLFLFYFCILFAF